jgi:hypothetical protein
MDITRPGMMAPVGKRKRNDPAAAYLSDDLVVEILSRLPERPLAAPLQVCVRTLPLLGRYWTCCVIGPACL